MTLRHSFYRTLHLTVKSQSLSLLQPYHATVYLLLRTPQCKTLAGISAGSKTITVLVPYPLSAPCSCSRSRSVPEIVLLRRRLAYIFSSAPNSLEDGCLQANLSNDHQPKRQDLNLQALFTRGRCCLPEGQAVSLFIGTVVSLFARFEKNRMRCFPASWAGTSAACPLHHAHLELHRSS